MVKTCEEVAEEHLAHMQWQKSWGPYPLSLPASYGLAPGVLVAPQLLGTGALEVAQNSKQDHVREDILSVE